METISMVDALKNGASEKELREAFEESLRKAKEQQHAQMLRDKEQKKLKAAREFRMNEARAGMIDAILEYLVAGGIEFENSATKNDFGTFLYGLIKDTEEELIFSRMKTTKEKDTEETEMADELVDAILNDFLKGLH